LKIRVIWIIDSLGQGGAEHLMPVILSHFDSSRFEHRVCALANRSGNPVAAKIKELGIAVDEVPVRNLRSPGNLPRLIRYLSHYQPDIVHTQLESANTLGTLAAAYLHIPSVSTLHVMKYLDWHSREYWRLRFMWAAFRLFNKRIFAVSESARQFFIKSEHISPHRIQTLYNGIDLSVFSAGKGDKQNEFNIPPGSKVILTVAYLREAKGIQYMLQALPAILAAHPECRYLIVGDGDYRLPLQNLARDLGIENNVVFTGSRQDIPRILALSDIFVLPTLDDALPTVLAEAMAARKAIVASEVGGIPEMVFHGKNGLLVTPRDPVKLAEACLDLLDHSEKSEGLGAMGFEIASRTFNVENQCRQLEDCYKKLAAGSK